jgi:UDP:flavonoid glycosyltransferase YjiC (YdhE family)
VRLASYSGRPPRKGPAAIRAAVRAVLDDPSYGERARRFRDAAATLPGLEAGVALLERLAREQTPFVAPAA